MISLGSNYIQVTANEFKKHHDMKPLEIGNYGSSSFLPLLLSALTCYESGLAYVTTCSKEIP